MKKITNSTIILGTGKYFVFLVLFMVFGLILSNPVEASNPQDNFPANVNEANLAEVLNETVGTAISPLLVIFVKLATQSDSEAVNPLLYVCGLLLLLILLKDVLPVSFLKKPLDATEELTSLLPALMGLVFILPQLMDLLTPATAESFQALLDSVGSSQAYAADSLEPVTPGVSDLAKWLGGTAVALAGTITYFAVWLLSNTLTILCLLVPAPLGPVVKSGRLAVLGFLYALSTYHPWLTLFFSIAIIIIAFLICRWSFKLTVWGGLYSFDILTLAWRRHKPGPKPMAFITGNGQKVLRIPKRTLGRLTIENGRLIFRYRYFLLLPREVELPPLNQIAIGQRLTSPLILQRIENRLVPLLSFRLSCRTHEELLAQQFGGLDVLKVGLSKWLKGAWSWLDRGFSRLNTSHPL